ncbi:hypothetical protein [Algoriphagus iocasae]|uniref:hypothetical protein n=1 Tax=Algoriphagus iocasae TaxID=1836499 RepID=UPI00161948BF|nr:hypothetical protein [Algoriphagus iocasae]
MASWFAVRHAVKPASRRAGKPDCGVCTEEHEPHTEAMRSDEVTHAAEVPTFRKGGSTKIVDVAAIGTRIFTLPRGLSVKNSSCGRI